MGRHGSPQIRRDPGTKMSGNPISRNSMNMMRAIPLALAISAALPAVALAADISPPQQRTIIVSGEGEVLAKPDQAHMSAAVVTQAPTAEAAAEQNAAAMNRVLSAVAVLGISPNR